ncbi:MAG TPA: acyl-CoA dehydrogenase family protein [Acidimicrobiales bacterium]
MTTSSTTIESVDAFRARAREWLAANMPPMPKGASPFDASAMEDPVKIAHARELQRKLYDGGFAGICYPKEYGGQSLTPEYQHAFTEETVPYEMPFMFNVPTLTIIAPTILDFGTEEQKQRHLRNILKGDELWVQFLSEPTGGSDLAGAITRATQDGDVFMLNGSKIWSSGAFRSDYALCLARTNWDAPKHRGLTMFIVKIHQPGITVEQIKQVNGAMEFCQEFFDDVAIPVADIMGALNDGWTVASRLLFHERNAVGGASPYSSGMRVSESRGPRRDLAELARAMGKADDSRVRQLVGEARANSLVQGQLIERVTQGIETGAMPAPAGALLRLATAVTHVRDVDIALDIAGTSAVTWKPGETTGEAGVSYIFRQGLCLGGGSNEMQRNIISERVLAMPRDRGEDRDLPFSEVRHNTMPGRKS